MREESGNFGELVTLRHGDHELPSPNKRSTEMPTKKKRKADEDVIPVPRSPKKQKQEASKPNAAIQDKVTAELDFSNLGEIGILSFPSIESLRV